MRKSVNILSTRPIDPSLIKIAGLKGIFIEVRSFIETLPVQSTTVIQEIENVLSKSATVVFTSMNAVDVVSKHLNGYKPQWNIYSIGTTTDQLIKKYFGENLIAGTAYNAADLAALIVKDRFIDEVIFFCGNQRRDELPDILRRNEIDVNEIEVYQTIAVPHKIDKNYSGILFFSPSAVESFFSNNTINQQTILFAIGNTTAEAIKPFSGNKIIISATPGKKKLAEQMIEYFGES